MITATKSDRSDNNPFDAETTHAIEVLTAKAKKGTKAVHIKTQEVGDSFLKNCRDRELSPQTLGGYVFHIKRLVTLSEWFPPEPEIVQQCLADIGGRYAADWYYRTWHALGTYAEKRYKVLNFMRNVTRPHITKQIMPTISAVELGRLALLLRDAPLRDKAIIALLVDTAIRSGEAANLKREDILEDRIIVHGKTGFRVAPLSPITRELLLALPATTDGYVFHGTNRKESKPLGHKGFWEMVHKYLRAAGYKGKQASPQTLRRSFGIFHLKDGGDLKSLSLILGHKNITTTANYYAPFLDEDVIAIHHKHTPGRVFESVNSQRESELAAVPALELKKGGVK